MKKQPLLILLICFVIGILCQEYFMLGSFVLYLFLLISGISLFSILIKSPFLQRVRYYSLGFFFFSIGIFVHFQNSVNPKILPLENEETIVFQVSKKLNSNEKNRRYVVEILDIPSAKISNSEPVKTVLSISKDQELLDFEHFYKAKVFIHQPEKKDNNFQFDYRKYLARQNIHLQAYLPNGILKTPKTRVSFPDKIRQKRLDILGKINHSPLSPPIQEFLKGIILSDRTEMDAETVKDFNQTGLVHLLAISGSHMVIIFWIISWSLSFIMPVKWRNFSIVLSLVFIWGFATFIDYGSSVMRSCLMITCYYIMVLLQRKPDLLHSLALSAFIILVVDSQQLFDVGFQLSYAAVLGIWWFVDPIKSIFRKPKSKLEDFFYGITAMTLAAQLSTLPLVLYYFHQFPLISIFANLIIIPLSEVIIISSLLMVIAIACGMTLVVVYQIFDVFIIYVLKLIHWFSSFEVLLVKNISMTGLEACILFFGLYYLRFVIVDCFKIKYLLRFGFCVLFFGAVRLGIDVYNYNKQEVLVHHFYKEKVISVKNKNQITFYINDNNNESKIKDFIIKPYIISRRSKDYKIENYPKAADAFVYDNKQYILK